MKNLIVAFALVITGGMAYSQSTTDATQMDPNAAEFQWVSETYDFGNIPQGIPAEARFEFTNTGKSDLYITDVQKTCGCTSTEWTKEPIKPGQKGYVTAVYNAASEGVFNKAIVVSSNTKTPSMKLYFKGTVVKDGDGGAPTQNSIFDGN
ncbi:MAG: DUF1573 domain-containing protein [Chitinophagales bacterium]